MPQYNNSIENGGKILSLFTQSRPRWGISEIARELGLSKTTAFNLVYTLEKIDFLVKNEETQKYELGIRLASIGSIMVANMELNQKSAGIIQELASTSGLSCRMGIWHQDGVLVVFSGSPTNLPQPPSYQAGPRVPGYSTAMGRAILSKMHSDEVTRYLDRIQLIKYTSATKIKKQEILKELADTQERGFSICNGEMIYGSSALGAPIINNKNIPVGGISLVGESELVLGPKMKHHANAICRGAQQISQSLGFGV